MLTTYSMAKPLLNLIGLMFVFYWYVFFSHTRMKDKDVLPSCKTDCSKEGNKILIPNIQGVWNKVVYRQLRKGMCLEQLIYIYIGCNWCLLVASAYFASCHIPWQRDMDQWMEIIKIPKDLKWKLVYDDVFLINLIPKDPQIPSEGRDYTGWNLLWGWDPIRLEWAWMDSYKLVRFEGLPKVTRIYKYGQIYSTPLKFNSSPLKRGGWTTTFLLKR